MKKWIALWLLLSLLMCLCSCTSTADTADYARFYYCPVTPSFETNTSGILAEVRNVSSHQGDMLGIVNDYLRGPVSPACRSPYISSVQCTDVALHGDTAFIYMNERFSELSGLDFYVACACLAKTVMELYGCGKIRIYSADNFYNGAIWADFSQDDFLMYDTI